MTNLRQKGSVKPYRHPAFSFWRGLQSGLASISFLYTSHFEPKRHILGGIPADWAAIRSDFQRAATKLNAQQDLR